MMFLMHLEGYAEYSIGKGVYQRLDIQLMPSLKTMIKITKKQPEAAWPSLAACVEKQGGRRMMEREACFKLYPL